MVDSKIFTFFKPKNDLFGEFLDPTYFRAAGPKKNFDPKKYFGYLFFFLKEKNSAGGATHGIGNRLGPRVWYRSPGGTPLPTPAQTLFGSLPLMWDISPPPHL